MTVVKICGIKNFEDARSAAEAGANMLGFNFYPSSPRYISSHDCARIATELRSSLAHARYGRGQPILLVGVFVNTPPVEILHIAGVCGLDLIQLSGDEPQGDLVQLEGRAFKVIRPRDQESAVLEAQRFARRNAPPALLLDGWKPGEYGGTGQLASLELARRIALEYHIFLAGGLNPENVTSAIRQVHPWGVDVASGVESSPGKKDPLKIAAFLQAVRAADSQQVPI